MSRLIFML